MGFTTFEMMFWFLMLFLNPTGPFLTQCSQKQGWNCLPFCNGTQAARIQGISEWNFNIFYLEGVHNIGRYFLILDAVSESKLHFQIQCPQKQGSNCLKHTDPNHCQVVFPHYPVSFGLQPPVIGHSRNIFHLNGIGLELSLIYFVTYLLFRRSCWQDLC